MSAMSRLNSIRATDCPPQKLRGEISAKAQPTTITEALRATVLAERGTVKRIAEDAGISEKRLYALADPCDPATLKASEVIALVRTTQSYAVLDAIESAVGRAGFQLPIVTVDQHAQVVEQTAKVVCEFGEALTRVSGSIADGRVSAAERQQITREIEDVYRALAELQAVVAARAA